MAEHRLTHNAIPKRYEIHLKVDLVDKTFTGLVKIELEISTDLESLTLNAVDLQIGQAIWTDVNGPCNCKTHFEPEYEQISLVPNRHIPIGNGWLEVPFSGTLDSQLRGFYSGTLFDVEGRENVFAATQFQTTDARRCFPCFDEPAFKAVFNITLDVPAQLLAISNGAEVSRIPIGDGYDQVTFMDTIPNSTYLVAFVIGPFEATQPIVIDGIPVRVVHPPGQGDLSSFAIAVANHSLHWLKDWYNIPIPGGKIDLVALPDFASGAMENIGCITFREVLLLVDPRSATQNELENIAAVISHELAHLWFGDLVTMAWWDGIWLNEAFATFMELKVIDTYRPDWKVWENHGRIRSRALNIDSLATTRPIEYPVTTPEEAEGMFDTVTYEKGASVVRMLEQFLGETVFRNGVRKYLADNLYGTTNNQDLWDPLEIISKQPVRELMHNWILCGGHPIIGVEPIDSKSVQLSQKPLRYDGKDDGSRWKVPIRLRSNHGERRLILDSQTMTLNDLSFDEIRSINVHASGFYRTSLAPDLDSPAIERAAYMADLWTFVLAGHRTYTDFLDLVEEWNQDIDLGIWQAALEGIEALNILAPGQFSEISRQLLGPIVRCLGWKAVADDDVRTLELRGLLIAASGIIAKDPKTLEQVKSLRNQEITDPSIASAVISVTAANGDTETYFEYCDKYQKADTAQMKQRYLRGLTRFPASTEVQLLLEQLLNGFIRRQDSPYLIKDLLTHSQHREMVWQTITNHWAEVQEKFPPNSIIRMIEGITWLIGDKTEPNPERFFVDNPITQGALQLDQHLERRRLHIRLSKHLRE